MIPGTSKCYLIWKKSLWLSRWALNTIRNIFIREGRRKFYTHTQWCEDGTGKVSPMLAWKIGAMWPQPKECQQLPEEAEDRFSLRASGESATLLKPWFQPSDTDTDFRLLASKAGKYQIFVVLNCQVCGHFFFFFYNSHRKLKQGESHLGSLHPREALTMSCTGPLGAPHTLSA